jgi:hypothetical protein
VSQSVGFIKASSRYLVTARVKVASGTAALVTTGADATSSFRDLSITTTSATFATLKGVVQTDSTPTALVVQVISSGSAATFDVAYVGVHEMTEDFDYADAIVPTVIARNSSQSQATTYVNGAWTAVPGGDVTITVPGPGYGIRITGQVSGKINTGGGQLDVRITANINGGGAAQVGGTVGETFAVLNVQETVDIYYAQQSVTAGDTWVVQLEGQTATNTVSSNPTSAASGDTLESSVVVELVPTGV